MNDSIIVPIGPSDGDIAGLCARVKRALDKAGLPAPAQEAFWREAGQQTNYHDLRKLVARHFATCLAPIT